VTACVAPSAALNVTEQVATPVARVTVAHTVVAPRVKVTVPAGVPVAGLDGETVAVKATGWPVTDGLPPTSTEVTVAVTPASTDWFAEAVDPVKPPSPE